MRNAIVVVICLAIGLAVLPGNGAAEQAASDQLAVEHGLVDAGTAHTCTVLAGGQVRCWGNGFFGALGYGNTQTIGDDEAPATAGTVDLGGGRTARAIAAGGQHTCAVLDTSEVRCWGNGSSGKLGYGNTTAIGDNEPPGSAGPVDLGGAAKAITAGDKHTCAVLDSGDVRCWGDGGNGQLGYGNTKPIGDDETPGSVGPVDLGAGRTARAISAGADHTCAVLDNGDVRCWGDGFAGVLGYANTDKIGDGETPGSVGPVDLGGRTAKAITAGTSHTCVVLDTDQVKCWGNGGQGRLGYGNTDTIGDTEKPSTVGTVDLGAGRSARGIAAGYEHTCALLDDGTVRCWGNGSIGRLGYGNSEAIGDNETPGSAGPVDLGAGRTARAITTGQLHTCALRDDTAVVCWGSGADGRLGYGNVATIGDNETPGSVAVGPGGSTPPPGPPPPPPPGPAGKAKPRSLSLTARARRGRIVASGTLALPAGARCEGSVTVTALRGRRTALRGNATLRRTRGACRYQRTLSTRRLRRGTRLTLKATFTGTQTVAGIASRARAVRTR
ncbi:MAG TPA: hypothetical protein VFZ89_13080 [Solirubrobacteraceae bacterium]